MIVPTVGERRVDALDGRDSGAGMPNGRPLSPGRQAARRRARMAIIVLKTALTFAHLPQAGLRRSRNILRDIDFPAPRPRKEAPTAAEIVAAGRPRTNLAIPPAALAYALQFEGAMRQWDVTGKWVPLSDKRPSLIIDGREVGRPDVVADR